MKRKLYLANKRNNKRKKNCRKKKYIYKFQPATD